MEDADQILGADMNGDGRPDIVVASSLTGEIGLLEQLEDGEFEVLAEIALAASGATSLLQVDLDADGDVDLLYASPETGEAVWLENDGASPPSFVEQILLDGAAGLVSLDVGDIDGDEDLDVVIAARDADSIQWLEHDSADEPSFTAHVVDASAAGAADVELVDLDNDGRLDVLAALSGEDAIALYTNEVHGASVFAKSILIEETPSAYHVRAFDFERDGDQDVVLFEHVPGGFDGVTFAKLHENDDGAFAGSIFVPGEPRGETLHAWTDGEVSAHQLFIGDLDMDGIPEVVVSRNLRSSRRTIASSLFANFLQTFEDHYAVADFDLDGDNDLVWVSSEDGFPFGFDQLFWARGRVAEHESTGEPFPDLSEALGGAAPGETVLSSVIATRDLTESVDFAEGVQLESPGPVWLGPEVGVTLADGSGIRVAPGNSGLRPGFGSGELELLGAVAVEAGARVTLGGGDIRLAGALSLAPMSTLLLEDGVVIETGSPLRLRRIDLGVDLGGQAVVADFDLDGDVDLAFPDNGALLVNQIIERGGAEFEVVDIEMTVIRDNRLLEADIDGDGLPDFVGLFAGDLNGVGADDLVVYRNLGGLEFSVSRFEIDPGDDPELFIADMNGDGADDLLAYSRQTLSPDDDLLSIYGFTGAEAIEVAPLGELMASGLSSRGILDIDGDGDTDLIFDGSVISIYFNDGGELPSFTQMDLPVEDEDLCRPGDVDGDGLIDLLIRATGPGDVTLIYWRLNDQTETPFSETIPVAEPFWGGTSAVGLDYDGDNDLDVIFTQREAGGEDVGIAVAEHTGAPERPYTGSYRVVAEDASFFDIADINGDGAPDLLQDGRIPLPQRWYENLPDDGPAFAKHEIDRAPLVTPWSETAAYGGRESSQRTLADFDLDGSLDVLLLRGAVRPPLEIHFGGHDAHTVHIDNATIVARSHLTFGTGRHDQVDLSSAEIQMEAGAGILRGEATEEAQEFEAPSTDLGPIASGFDRSVVGSYPIGTLRIGPSPTHVALVDEFENDGRSGAIQEAVYVDQLILHAGSVLETNGISVYYREALLQGEVIGAESLRPVREGCPWDLTGDRYVDALDLATLLSWWGSEETPLDFAGDGEVNAVDIAEMLSRWGACE